MTLSLDRLASLASPRVLLALALVVGVLGVQAGRGTLAYFTETVSVGSNTFTTGTVDISVSPAATIAQYAGMAPGDRTVGAVTIANDGSLELRYAVQASATDADSKDLRSQLKYRIGLRGGVSCEAASAYFNADGTPGTLTADTQLVAASTGFPGTATSILGDATQGDQLGDRTLPATNSEVLCIAVALPSGVGNAYQGATTEVTFDFISEQTANN